jgi:hypothetical protein
MLEEQVNVEDVQAIVEDEDADEEQFELPQMSDQESFVRAALTGDAVVAQDIANQLIAARVGVKVDDMRSAAAASLIQSGEDLDDDESNPES